MDILEFIKEVISEDQVMTLIYLILANVVLGTIAALVKGKFELARFRDFGKRTLIILGSYLGVSVAAHAMSDFDALRTVYWAALIAFMATQLVDNLKDIGLPVPDSVSRVLEKK